MLKAIRCRIRSWLRKPSNHPWVKMAVIGSILCLPPVIVLLLMGDLIRFEPSRFVEEYWKFAGSLLAVYLGFHLVHKFWKDEQKRQELRRGRLRLSRELEELIGDLEELIAILGDNKEDEKFTLDNDMHATLLVHRLRALLAQLASIMVGIDDENLDWFDLEFDAKVSQRLQILLVSPPSSFWNEEIENLRQAHSNARGLLERIGGLE